MFCEDAFCVPVCLLIILYVLVVSLWMSRLFQVVLACALFTLSVILLLISGFDLILVCVIFGCGSMRGDLESGRVRVSMVL